MVHWSKESLLQHYVTTPKSPWGETVAGRAFAPGKSLPCAFNLIVLAYSMISSNNGPSPKNSFILYFLTIHRARRCPASIARGQKYPAATVQTNAIPLSRGSFPFWENYRKSSREAGTGKTTVRCQLPSEFSWQPTRSKFMAVFNAERSIELWKFIDRFIDESHSQGPRKVQGSPLRGR